MNAPALVDRAAVMTRLGVGKEALQSLILSGKLPALKVGRRWRFDPRDVESYLRSAKFTPRLKPAPVAVSRPRSRRSAAMSAGADRYM